MKILCTFPGKFGDLLWALPTIRALSERIGEPIDLLIAGRFLSITSLIAAQPYIGRCLALDAWQVEDTAPMSPRVPPFHPDGIMASADGDTYRYDRVIHLGYRDWPTPDVITHTHMTLNLWRAFGKLTELGPITADDLGLDRPWITHSGKSLTPAPGGPTLAIAFTDEHFELKLGLTIAVIERVMRARPYGCYAVLTTPNSRWSTETWDSWRSLHAGGWFEYARCIQAADLVLADCSAAHVLAVAMGKPVVLMEPNPHRHNQVFYPLGKTGRRVHLVCGNDGQPTFDARHVYDAIAERLPV